MKLYASRRLTTTEFDCRLHGPECYGCAFETSYEVDAEQHNTPNPILIAYRENGSDNPDAWVAASWAFQMFGGFTEWSDPRAYFHSFVRATTEQNLHARRVFERLVSS